MDIVDLLHVVGTALLGIAIVAMVAGTSGFVGRAGVPVTELIRFALRAAIVAIVAATGLAYLSQKGDP